MKLGRRAALAGTIAIAGANTGRAEEPLKLVLGFPPGASSDTLTRLVADKMRVSLKRTVVVENKPGAVGIVANLAVKAAPPDGNTLLMTPLAPMVAFPHSYSKLDYDPFKDYVPVAELCAFYLALGVGSAVPAKTLAEYAALVKTGGTYANFASAAAGSLPHFFGLMFAKAAGVQLTHIPYKGTASVMQAMMSGEIPAAVLTVADWGTLQQSGKGRMLAVSSPKRLAQYPDVPTFKESGYAIEGSAWYGLFAPAGTPQPIVDKLHALLVKILAEPGVKAQFAKQGAEAAASSPQEFGAYIAAEITRWKKVAEDAGITPE